MARDSSTFDIILSDVQNGNISNIEGLVANSDAEILSEIGAGNYDELLYAALDAGNVQMLRTLLKRSNLIQAPLEGIVDSLTGEKAGEIKKELNQFIRSVNRSNMQKRDWGEWQSELKKAKENGYYDLADRLQNRMDFENNQRLEGEGKRPAGTSENRWFMDEEAWFIDGFGRMEYDLYGQNNGQAIVDELTGAGIHADLSAYIKNEKTGDLNDYRIYVDEKDVDKLNKFLSQKRDDAINQETVEALRMPIEEDERDPDEPDTQPEAIPAAEMEKLKAQEEQLKQQKTTQKPKMPLWMPTGMMPQFEEEKNETVIRKKTRVIQENDVKADERPEVDPVKEADSVQVQDEKNSTVKDVLTPEERAVVNKYYQVGTYNDLTPEEQQVWRGLGPKVEQANSAQEVLDIIGAEYKIKKDGTIRVDGSVPLGHLDLKKLPDLSNVIVGGNFSCRDNFITDLTGAPRLVEGAFLAEGNPPMSPNRPFVAKKGIFFAPRQTEHDEIQKTEQKGDIKMPETKKATTDDMIFADPDLEGAEASASPDVAQNNEPKPQEVVQDVTPKKKTMFRDLNNLDAHMSRSEVLTRLEDVELPKNDNGQKALLDELKRQYAGKGKIQGLNGRINTADMLKFAQHIDNVIDDGEPDNIDFTQGRDVMIRSLATLDRHLQIGEVLARLEDVAAKTKDPNEQALLDLVREGYESKRKHPENDLSGLDSFVDSTAGVNLAERIDLAIDDGEIENVKCHINDVIDVNEPKAKEEKTVVQPPKRPLGMNKFQKININPDDLPKPKTTTKDDDVPPTAGDSGLPPIVEEEEPIARSRSSRPEIEDDEPVVRRRGGRPVVEDENDEAVIRRRGGRPAIEDENDEAVIRRRGGRPVVDENDETVIRRRGGRPEIEDEGEETDLDGRPVSWRLPEGAIQNGPGFEELWERAPSMNFKMTHVAKDSFKPYLRPYYFNPNNLAPEVRDRALKMLTSRGIVPQQTWALNDMNDSLNPVKKGEAVWVIGGEYDADGREVPYAERKNQIEMLQTFWKAGRNNPDIRFGTDLDKKPTGDRGMPTLPGLKGNWEQAPSMNLRMTHVAKDSFKRHLRPYYFNPNNLSPEDRELALKMLTSRGIYPQPGMAPKGMEKSANPIREGEAVWVIGGEFDGEGKEVPYAERKEQLKKLNALWKLGLKNPAVAFGKDVEIDRPKGRGGRGGLDLPPIVEDGGKGGKSPKTSGREGNENGLDDFLRGAGAAVKLQGKDLLDATEDAINKFNARVFSDKIDSPEALGSEFLFAMMAFPFNFLDPYLQIKADRAWDMPKDLKTKKDSPVKTEDDKLRQAKALRDFMKKMMEKDPELFAEMRKKGIIGPELQNIPPERQRVVLSEIFEHEPELDKRLKSCFAETAEENPDLLRGMYPSNYKGPITPDVLLNHVMGWKQDDNSDVITQGRGGQQPQPIVTPENQGLGDLQALAQELRSLRGEIQALRTEIAQLKQENEQLRQENAQLSAQNKALQAQLEGKVATPQQPTVATPTVDGPTNPGAGESVPPTTPVAEQPKTEERTVPDLNKLGSLNMLNNSMAKAIMDDDVPGFKETASMTPEELANNPKAQFFNAVREAYSKSEKPTNLNDLIKTDKEAQWAEELAHAVENDNADNVPRIKKDIVITGEDKPKEPVAPTLDNAAKTPDSPTPQAAVEDPSKPAVSQPVTPEQLRTIIEESMQKLLNANGYDLNKANFVVSKIAEAQLEGKAAAQIKKDAQALKAKGEQVQKKEVRINKALKEWSERSQNAEFLSSLELKEGKVVHKETKAELTQAELSKVSTSKQATMENITTLLQARSEAGKTAAAASSNYKSVPQKPPRMTEGELKYLEDHPALKNYDLNAEKSGFVVRETGEKVSAEDVIRRTTNHEWGYDRRKPSQAYSKPDKLIALMAKVERNPEFSKQYHDLNRSGPLPRTTAKKMPTSRGSER